MEMRAVTDIPGIQERAGGQENTLEKKGSTQKGVPGGEIQQEKSYSKEEVGKEVGHLNKWLESKNSHLHFVLYDKLNEYYVQIVSDHTNEVIKEIPSKKMMDIVANFYEKLGIIVDKKI